MELAAIASAAVPGLAPTGVAGTPDDAADFDSALLVDDAGKQWRVRSPKHAEASMRLETELQALRAFSPAIKAELPFLVPHMAGSVRQGELSTFVYSHLTGTAHSLAGLAARGQAMAQELGRVLAAIHELPQELVQRADLPSYEANEYRQRKLNELDQAATTGRIPSILLRRWEHALEDVTLWRFSPTVVHGDLHEDHLLVSAGRVSAVTGWTDLCVGDPAEDFAWLAAAEDTAFADAVHTAYADARATAVDAHLPRRAALAAEFALAQWLVRGTALDDSAMIAEAETMLATLAADVESIEREQHAAAERERREQEERLEWGNDVGADASGHPDNPAGAADEYQGSSDGWSASGTGSTAVAGHAVGSADERQRTAGDSAVHSSQPSPVEPDPRIGEPERTGSHAHEPVTYSVSDQRPGGHLGRDDGHAAPSGASLAYARLTAGRARPTSSSSSSPKVTMLRSGEHAGGTADDVATSALPIVSFGS